MKKSKKMYNTNSGSDSFIELQLNLSITTT